MPFSREDAYKALQFLNQALIRNYPYQLQSVPEYFGYDSVLTPEEYHAEQVRPKLFEIATIQQRMDSLQAESEYLVGSIQSILSELTLNDQRVSDELNSANHAMVRADVVEWDQKARTSGMMARREELIENLRQGLQFPPSPKGSGMSAANLYRC